MRDYLKELCQHLRAVGLPDPTPEHAFHPTRKWRFDLAWPDRQIAVEYQGGIYLSKGGHSTVAGLSRDYEKFTEAQLLGWKLILVTAQTVRDGRALQWIERAWGRNA